MKKPLLLLAFAGSISLAFSQEYTNSYYGVKLGINHSTMTYDPEIDGVKTSFKDPGFAGGIFYNYGLSEKTSLQPEILFSRMGCDLENNFATPKVESILKLTYLSIPVLFKWTPTWRLGIFAGPQIDFMVSATNKVSGQDPVKQTDNFDLYDFAGTVGAEFWFTRNIALYARWMQGLNNIADVNDQSWAWPSTVNDVKSHGWQWGITVALRNKKKTEPAPAPAPAPVPAPAPAPVPAPAPKDTDGDGVTDDLDKCPNVAGLADNMGCPELIVYFLRAEAGLTDDDKVSLDRVVKFMNNNPTLNITVEGHTSSPGGEAFNQTLSEQRANEAVDYLVSKGISKSRMTAVGQGEKFPIGDNTTEEGKAKSRRVVIKIAK